jgi:NAD(P)-dependent dehydrogenase (short-subunit alcohol dehydrogenase family)
MWTFVHISDRPAQSMAKNKPSRGAVAVVTGAGSGIGRAFALELARRGGRVVCTDINLATAQETARLIGDSGGKAAAVSCDVGRLEAVQALAEQAPKLLGAPVDLVVNNAGIGIGGKQIGEFGIDDWRATMDVNLWGVIHGCHVFTPQLRQLGRGGILNVASTASFAAAPSMGPYNVTKAAVLALTETLAAELAGSGVRVSALCPTFVKTNIVRDGRIEPGATRLATRLMSWTGVDAGRVARQALDALDRGQLYMLPQLDARMIWRLKRWMPESYGRGAGVLGRVLNRAG